jgi:hypothetical protein
MLLVLVGDGLGIEGKTYQRHFILKFDPLK